VVITKLTIIASVFRPGESVGPELSRISVDIRTIQKFEKRVERRAQAEAAAAPIADIGHPEPFLVERIRQIVIRHRLLLKKTGPGDLY
jgi:hypothetical protein